MGGSLLTDYGLTWFNPDDYARVLVKQLGLDATQANARAWEEGRARLEAALLQGTNYAFETTLGGNTITRLLIQAQTTHRLMMIFCGLSSPEQHFRRVQLRVAFGGHDIPEQKINERWVTSRANLIRLLPLLTRLQVFDNSADAAPGADIPDPVLLLEMVGGKVVFPALNDGPALARTPAWARPLLEAGLALSEG